MIQSLWGKVLLIIVIHNHGFIISGSHGLQGNRKFTRDNFMVEGVFLEIGLFNKGVINIQKTL